MPDDPSAVLAEIRARVDAATAGPWWSDEDELMWRLHGVHGYTPAMPDLGIAPQVINHQILKAPKSGTPYAEYWPGEADAAFIVAARSDVPRLLAAVEAVLKAAGDAKAVLSYPPADCRDDCDHGPCTCSGKFRAAGWDLDPEALREAITRALLGDPEDAAPGPAGQCDLCGEPHNPALLNRVLIGGEWVSACLDCREAGNG